jgi:hypothetical protein
MSKYKNVKTIVDGIAFDSKKEGARHGELQLLAKAGAIQDLRLQMPFELIPKQAGERAVRYIADFVYMENGKMIVEDVKGVKTDVYKIKKKLMLAVHGIRIREV